MREIIENLCETVFMLIKGIIYLIKLPFMLINWKNEEKKEREENKSNEKKSLWGPCIVWGAFLGIIALCVFSLNSKTNLQKFNEIEIDLAAAGVNKSVLQREFKKAPLDCRREVEQHRRKRFLFITREHEKGIGRQFVTAMEKADILWKNKKDEDRCNFILEKLGKVMPEHFTAPKKVYILDTPEINACCLPDGTVVIFKGLLENFTDDEVAWVIAHELGHGVAHHSAEMITKSILEELALDTLIDKETGLLKIVGSRIAVFMTSMKYSRVQEDEADRLSLFYLNKANFSMQGAITALNKFKGDAGEKSAWKEWLSTHPHPENRLKNVQTAIEQLKEDPDHRWGGVKDILLEKAKVKAIELYLKTYEKKVKKMTK